MSDFDPDAPLPPMRNHGKNSRDSWEPASRRYKDIDAPELLNNTRPTKAER